MMMRPRRCVQVVIGLWIMSLCAPQLLAKELNSQPSVLLITVDALRPDRLSCYGYQRPTSASIDQLLARGARFEQARTIEPLTNPSLTSLMTSLPPHIHGATRNGLCMRPGLASLPKQLHAHGWQTAGFVSNWTLKNKVSRLGEHFDVYEGIFTRRRWFGLFNREATARDVTERAGSWLEDRDRSRPFFLWLHFVEPHAPYVFHKSAAKALEISGKPSKRDRYDTEVHWVDAEIGRFLKYMKSLPEASNMIIVFGADHGESLGEHGYWGHGRHLYENSLRIPLGFVWPGRIRPMTVKNPATILDLAPTILDLVGVEAPRSFTGLSWAGKLLDTGASPQEETMCFQAHRGAVLVKHQSDRARGSGLLAVGVIHGDIKEVLDLRKNKTHLIFDLKEDPHETRNLHGQAHGSSDELMSCFLKITQGLGNLPDLADSRLDDESRAQLKALGYLE